MVREQSTAKGFTLMSVANFVCRFLSILYVPILTRLIGNEGNGIFNSGYVVYMLLFEITYMGIPVAISKMVSKYNAEKRYYDSLRTLRIAGGLLICVGFVCGAIMALFHAQIASFLNSDGAWLTILLLSPAILFSSFSAAIRGFFQGHKNMTYTSVSQVIEQAIHAISTPLLAFLFMRLAQQQGLSNGEQLIRAAGGASIGTCLGALISVIYLICALGSNYKTIKQQANDDYIKNKLIKRESDYSMLKLIISTAVPIVMGVALVYFVNLIDVKLIKGRLLAAGFDDPTVRESIYGIFSTQYHKTTNIVLGIAATLPVTIMPGISRASALGDSPLLKRKINNAMRASFLVTIPASTGLAVMAVPIMRILFSGYDSVVAPGVASPALLIIAGVWSIIIVSVVQVETAVLQGVGHFKTPPINMAIGLGIKIILSYFLIAVPKLNIMGAIIGTYICYTVVAVLDYIAVVKYTKTKPNIPKLAFPSLLASIIMGAIVFGMYTCIKIAISKVTVFGYIANIILSAVCIAVGAVIYIVLALKFKAIDKDDFSTVPIIGRVFTKPRVAAIINKIIN